MKLSENGFYLIRMFEGQKNYAYLDSINLPTIGIGFIQVGGKKVKMGDYMTDKQIQDEFFIQIKQYEKCVNDTIKVPLTQNQYDSCVSFAFNLGCSAFSKSTLAKIINKNPNDEAIKAEWSKWCRAGGKVIQGLVNRRSAEILNYFKK